MDADFRGFFASACPELHGFAERLATKALPPTIIAAALGHLADPTAPAGALAASTGVTLDEVREAYRFLRDDPDVAALTTSMFYPHRLRYAFAVATLAEWTAEPARVDRLLAGLPVLAKTVEIHPSKGTCTYRCAMCLWSDKRTLTYATRDLTADGLLSTTSWRRALDELRAGGAETLVVSGGGEALLNRELPTILQHARSLGFRVHLYTTGYQLGGDGALWEQVMGIDRLRLSIHSPYESTYNRITGLPARLKALARVSAHIGHLVAQRREQGTGPRVGIGFVTQPLNHREIQPMAQFAADLAVDFLDLRKDEVDVTEGLAPEQLRVVREQLVAVRRTALRGGYGATTMDLADELVSLANGQPTYQARTAECLAKYFRPTISPFGIVAPCDLKAEPRFADSRFNLGTIPRHRVLDVVDKMAGRFVPDTCSQCMPSSRTGNAVYHKLLTDSREGLDLSDQPFALTRSVVA